MKKTERIITIIMLLAISLSDLGAPVSYAAQLEISSFPKTTAKSVDQNTPVASPQFQQPDHGSVLGASTSLLVVGSGTDTQNSASKRVPLRMQQLPKKVYQTNEDVTLAVTNPDNDPFTTVVRDTKGKAIEVPVSESTDGTTTDVQLTGSNEITPGKYTIQVMDDQGNVLKQDFSWGVLAMNFDKDVYHEGDASNISFGVLDDQGNMVCDANLQLRVTSSALGIDDTLSTNAASSSAQITVNPQCQKHDFSLQPDYQASYTFTKSGDYTMQLTATTEKGTHTLTQTVPVKDTTPFEIQRISATRIYPPNTYPMTINIKANRDFSGTVTETVPQTFTITPATQSAEFTSGTVPTSYTDMQTLYLNSQDPAIQLQQEIATQSAGLVMPFQGDYPITQGFGAQMTDPLLQAFYTRYGLSGHDGIDFGVPMNTPLYAVDNGNIIWSGPGDYGITIIIRNAWGESYYGHLSNTAVTVGENVTKGQLIGYSGESGEATGPHLHFGMKPNNPDLQNGYYGKVDPLIYLPYNQTPQPLGSLGSLLNSSPVLGASTSADSVPSPTPSQSPTPTIEPTPLASVSATPTVLLSPTATPSAAPQSQSTTTITESTTPPANTAISVLDKQILLNEQLANSTQTEKVKVISWQVSLKKGQTTSLGYDFKAPPQSPQFYLLGPLQFYQSGSNKVVFQEQRAWQIASDDVGVEWYNNTTGSSWNGYSWQYRKKIDVSHSQVGAGVGARPTATFIDSGGDATQGVQFWTQHAACVASNTFANTGSYSNGCDQGNWNGINSVVSDTGTRISFYFYMPALQSTINEHIATTITNNNGTQEMGLFVNGTTSKLNDQGSVSGTTVLQAGQWYRIDMSYTVTSTTVNSLKVYLNGHLEISDNNETLGTTGAQELELGRLSGTGTAGLWYFDDVYVDSGSDLSDAGDVHVTAKLPISDGASNGYTTNGSASGTACTTGTHCQYVNERPINTSNFLSTSAASTSENFTLQSTSQGDVDISKGALLADSAWVDADASAGCTAKITNNGTNTNITLTTSFAVYPTAPALVSLINGIYPSGNQGIGIQACSSGTTRLAEAGMQIAYIPAASGNYTNLTPTYIDSGGDAVDTNGGTNFEKFYDGTGTGTSGSMQASTTTSETGPDALQFHTGTNATSSYAYIYKNNVLSDTGSRISTYVNFTNLPANNSGILCACASNTASEALLLSITTTGALYVVNNSGTQIGSSSSTSLSTNTWYRIAFSYKITSTTSYAFNVYINGAIAISYSQTSGGTTITTGTNAIAIGWASGNDGNGVDKVDYFDDIYVDNGTDISAPGDIHVTAKLPIAKGASNDAYAVNGSAGGTACTSGSNCQYVNERPLNVNNYLSKNVANTRENFTLQSASQGDVDISSAGIIADEAWGYANTSSACTGQLTNNGTDSSISLTTTNTMFISLTTNANFLSGSQGVGIQSCTSTQTVKLFEAGMQVAYTNNNPDNTQTNFPVLVNLSSDTDLQNHAQSSGNDILFTDSTGETLLPYEIESYTNGTGSLQAWVNISSLSTVNDTIIYMYFGNPSASSLANKTGTWNSNYVAVYHLGENAANTTISDSTTDAYNGTAARNTTNTATTGQIDGGQNLSGASTDKIDIGNRANLNFGLGSFTFFTWVNEPSAESCVIFWNGAGGSSEQGYDLEDGSGIWKFHLADNGGVNYPTGQITGVYNSWKNLAFTVDRNGGFVNPYLNGSAQTNASLGSLGNTSNTRDITVGTYPPSPAGEYYTGKIDEIEISNVALSPGWIQTQYNNQNSPSTFATLGNVETDIYAPLLSQILRHGQFFGSVGVESGVLQPFTW